MAVALEAFQQMKIVVVEVLVGETSFLVASHEYAAAARFGSHQRAQLAHQYLAKAESVLVMLLAWFLSDQDGKAVPVQGRRTHSNASGSLQTHIQVVQWLLEQPAPW